MLIWKGANPRGRASSRKGTGFHFAFTREFPGPSRGVDLARISTLIFPSVPRRANTTEGVYIANSPSYMARSRLASNDISLRRADPPLM